MPPMSLWRPDKMRDLTYTQFWELVRERQIDSVGLVCMTARQSQPTRQAMLFGPDMCVIGLAQTEGAPGPLPMCLHVCCC